MILLIDNYDSFVHNLARHFGLLGYERTVVRNTDITLNEIERLQPLAIVLSPGPCTPRKAGICLPLIASLHKQFPILGICLGHQCIGEAFGGQTIRARTPVHGKSSRIIHTAEGLFTGLPSPLEGGRYHSLVVDLPTHSPLIVDAHADGEIMALRHPDFPVYGLQFHPESILTPNGLDLLRNFMNVAEEWNARRGTAHDRLPERAIY